MIQPSAGEGEDMGDLEGKVAIVTGASRGIGKETALELARAGADVVVAARTVERRSRLPGTIYETVEGIQAMRRRAVAVVTDVSKASDLDRLVATAIEEMGRCRRVGQQCRLHQRPCLDPARLGDEPRGLGAAVRH